MVSIYPNRVVFNREQQRLDALGNNNVAALRRSLSSALALALLITEVVSSVALLITDTIGTVHLQAHRQVMRVLLLRIRIVKSMKSARPILLVFRSQQRRGLDETHGCDLGFSAEGHAFCVLQNDEISRHCLTGLSRLLSLYGHRL